MKKMSVADAAEFFGVSREAIHNRIRRGSLQVLLENGVKKVLVDENKVKKPAPKKAEVTASNDERYYKLLEAQNAKLQERVEKLENETRTLRDQKEQMLIEERQKIEAIYKEKDEQLKSVLQTLSSKFMLGAPLEEPEEAHVETVEMVEVEVEEEAKKEEKVISLKKYLKSSGFSDKKRQKIKKRFKEKAKRDERIITIGSKYYLDVSKYDYKDLIK